MMTRPIVLEARGINLAFGAVVAARDLNVAIAEGETIGVIGANGAGKTTFVNTVTGYLKPDSGRVIYLGKDITPLGPREISWLGIRRSFQIPQLFVDLTTRQNLLIAIGIAQERRPSPWRRLDTPERSAQVEAILARLGLVSYRDSLAGVLPQGVRKLIDIAMTLAGEPRVLLLDEPTSGVSADEKFAIMDRIMGSVRQTGMTVLFVEHDMELVERYAARVIAFYDGRIIADGPTEAVLAAPEVRRHVVGSEIHRRVAGGGRVC